MNPFKNVTIKTMIERELDVAYRSLLQAQSAVDWAQSQVEYNQKRISRLVSQKNELSSNVQPRQD